MRMELVGADRLAAMFRKAEDAGQSKLFDRALTDVAQTVLNESKELVPVDRGTLKNSGQVEKPKRDATGVEVEITYGGDARAYARRVHEDMKARHKDGKTAKYLEKPVMAYQDKFVRIVTERFATYLKRGG